MMTEGVVANIKNVFGLSASEKLLFIEDETGEYLFVIKSKSSGEPVGYIRRCESFFNFFNTAGVVVHSEPASILIQAVAALKCTEIDAATVNAVRDAFQTKSSVQIMADTSEGFMYRVQKKKNGKVVGWATRNKNLICFYAEKSRELVLKVPQARLSALIFGVRDALSEIRMLYSTTGESVLVVRNEELSAAKPWSMRIVSNTDDVATRQHWGWCHIKDDVYYFYSIGGHLLRSFLKADMPPAISGWDVPVTNQFEDRVNFPPPQQQHQQHQQVQGNTTMKSMRQTLQVASAEDVDNNAATAPPLAIIATAADDVSGAGVPIQMWTVQQVANHFASLGMNDVASIHQEVINGSALCALSENDLKELKVPMGVRKNHLAFMRNIGL